MYKGAGRRLAGKRDRLIYIQGSPLTLLKISFAIGPKAAVWECEVVKMEIPLRHASPLLYLHERVKRVKQIYYVA